MILCHKHVDLLIHQVDSLIRFDTLLMANRILSRQLILAYNAMSTDVITCIR